MHIYQADLVNRVIWFNDLQLFFTNSFKCGIVYNILKSVQFASINFSRSQFPIGKTSTVYCQKLQQKLNKSENVAETKSIDPEKAIYLNSISISLYSLHIAIARSSKFMGVLYITAFDSPKKAIYFRVKVQTFFLPKLTFKFLKKVILIFQFSFNF